MVRTIPDSRATIQILSILKAGSSRDTISEHQQSAGFHRIDNYRPSLHVVYSLIRRLFLGMPVSAAEATIPWLLVM